MGGFFFNKEESVCLLKSYFSTSLALFGAQETKGMVYPSIGVLVLNSQPDFFYTNHL